MSRQKKQATLLQAWSNTPSTAKKPTPTHTLEEIDLTEEITEEDLLFAKALDESLAEYEAAQASTSTAQHVETLPGFDNEAGKTWIYPTNYPIRKYQFSIVEQALFKNTIVILPTGLGKTFIAAVVMYNYFRWYPRGKIIFMAPTKPLVAQQIEACFNIMGIPLAVSAEMTGAMQPEIRRQTWRDKRVFFITPQVMNNDLARGICPAADVKLLVFDEAHKATKDYAYCQVINEVVKYSLQFRVLALSATPGSDIATVKQVFQNLLISNVELRTEDSTDIRPYTFNRIVETIIVPMNEELKRIIDGVIAVLTGYIERLKRHQVLFCNNVASVKQYHLIKSREQFRQNLGKKMSKDISGAIEGSFSMAITIAHAYEMLLIYGLRSFYSFVQEHIDGLKGYPKLRSELLRNDTLTTIMDELRAKFDQEKDENQDSIISHPKLSIVEQLIKEHFTKFEKDHGDQSSTRVMVFSAYRCSVDEITNILNRNRPLIRAMSFTGQATSSSSKGITQKEQIAIVQQFRRGGYNTLVATCVGEEGLDIGDVDLIICFDVYKSPIRLIQRMGRTGRKRDGRIVMLTTEGREEQVYDQSKAKAASIHKSICKENFKSLYMQNPRMVPKGLNPHCHKMHITVSKYQRTTGRKKKDSDAADGLSRFLTRHAGKKDAAESVNDEIGVVEKDEEKTTCVNEKKRKDLKKDNIQKPNRINKKQKQALILDDSDDDELMINPFEIRKDESESEKIESMDIVENENDWDMQVEEQHCIPEDCVSIADEDEFEDDSDGNFFPETTTKLNSSTNRKERKVRSPPNFKCVFSKSKEELSPLDYEKLLQDDHVEETFKLPVIPQHKNVIEFPLESTGFVFESPEKLSMDFDFPTSPILTSVVNISSKDKLDDDEVCDVDNVLNKSAENVAKYSVTQLIDMVYEDSMRITVEEQQGTPKKETETKSDENFTRINEMANDGEKEENKIDETRTSIVPNFDLKFNYNFDDTDDDIIQSSQIENIPFNTTKDVTFEMKIQEIFDESTDEIESSLVTNVVSEKPMPSYVTSTPKVQQQKSVKENDDSNFDWDNLPHVKCVKFQTNKKNLKKTNLSRKLIESQALVTDKNHSDDESESELDILESSFIDDRTQAVENTMTAVYLKSIRDNVGPRQFKINSIKEINKSDVPPMTQDEYQEDSFCIANDTVEFAENSKEEQKAEKKWKRIIKNHDSTLKTSEIVPARDEEEITPIRETIQIEEMAQTKETIQSGKAVLNRVDVPTTSSLNNASKSDDNVLVLVDSKEINGSHQLISDLRHQHKIQIHVVSLNSCDYVVSTRMGVERKLFSSIANIQSKNRFVERISSMTYLFDRTCLIIEADREKTGTKKSSAVIYYNRLISALLQLPIKILFADSQADTARILKELAIDEKKKGFGLPIECTLPLSKKEQQLCRLYQSFPVVNYVTALNLCRNTLSVQQLVNSSASVIQRKGNVNESKANDIVNFIKQNFNL